MLKILLVMASITTKISSDNFTIGYLTGSQRRPGDREYSRPGLTISGAISLAVEEVNRTLAKRGHQIYFIVEETFGEEIISVQKTADLWTRNVSAYIGPQETCEHEAFMASAFNVPMISYFCTYSATSDKAKFPTFARTRPPDTQISKSVVSVLTAFNWTHVVLLYLKSPEFEFINIATILKDTLPVFGITIIATKFWDSPYHHGYMDNPFVKLVEETYRDTRIFVILGHHYEHLGLMIAMEEKKLFDKGEYFVVGVDIEQYDDKNPSKYLRGLLRDSDFPNDPVAQRAYKSYLGIVPSSPVGFENFTVMVNNYMEKPPFSFPNPLSQFGGGKLVRSWQLVASLRKPQNFLQIRAEAAYLYDAVHVYAKALMKVMDSGGDPRNGTAIVEAMKNTHYKSAMGYIVFMDENGDAEGNYTLIARKVLRHNKEQFGLFPVGIFARTASRLPVLHLIDSIDWINGEPPIAAPFCGFRGEKCITHTIEITGGVAGGVVLIMLIICLVLYRNWKYEQELDSLLWKIDYRDMEINGEPNSNVVGNKLPRSNQPFIRTSQVSLSSNPDADFRYSTIFTQIGIYKGRVFAIKKVHKKSIDITREMKKELKLMRDLRHDNLIAFIGACTDPPNICIVTEYCTRGSLKDILENEDVKLDNMFIASLVGDILRGMIYLHESPIRFHGALNSANCLVDSRWVVKLSDFGLREFKKGSDDFSLKDPARIREKCYKLLYRAPELLRLQDSFLAKDQPMGTQKGDIYSFGIILFELHNRHGPFGDLPFSPGEILNKVIHCSNPASPFRPPLDKLENSCDFVKDCLKECWMEGPEERPDFKSIRTKLRPLRKGMKPNIFDNMMAMMEKYANNLEVLVDERTDQLQEEKKKTEALLYEMLPKPVADQLKKGNKVEAEGFDCVTIYFSDIVGFTAMSAESTPLQVVNFLNDLYTCFDSIIENYDVYKVETIGDAYMVVSGLPIKNDYQHAAEIATMSLHLLSEVKNFTIRHRPGQRLMLRIGIHSGPVCAGVVGLKMPRYCLFGDTVNTASRMESTGQPLKIHCSRACRDLLSRLGGYQLIERGLVTMKGKGDQQTYWLLGEDFHFRKLRKELREKRRAEWRGRTVRTSNPDGNGHYIVTRSSLKNKNSIVRSPIPRCSSFESPKRLRFANGDHLEKRSENKYLEAITDNSPSRKDFQCLDSDSLVTPYTIDCCADIWKAASTSCPCIENLATSAALVAQTQLAILSDDQKLARPICYSVPTLCCHLSVPQGIPVHTISAPTSPRKQEVDLLARYSRDAEEIPVWTESAPLLKITTPLDSETTCV
ncbi:guanylate cyclase 32E isoform X2 [Dendroctonus ponderosae]|uniref:Guanylate cyclase n=1 Tax=Dendroctonus ponderosae TaxID=77166 RepID=A0AAR5P6C5_DENPD|nr:guanylate cyclase 32E isoform X2 [Dendroctonus ponderosae]